MENKIMGAFIVFVLGWLAGRVTEAIALGNFGF